MSNVRDPGTRIPFNKPFFREGCVVKRNSRTLVEGVDFYFGHTYVLGTLRHGKLAYGSVWVFNKADLNGLTVTAEQLPHGEATPAQITAEENKNKDVIPPYRFWDEVVADAYYPPINVPFDEDNWCGELELMEKIGQLNNAIASKDKTEDDLYKLAVVWFEAVEAMLQQSPIHDHLININNPHREEYNWIDALSVGAQAANASKLFGRTLPQLTQYINERSASQSDLNIKLLKIGRKIITDGIRFKNGVGYISTTNTQISINNKQLAVTARDEVKIDTKSKAIHFKAGNNTLSLYPDNRRLRFNNVELLNTDTVGPHIPTSNNVFVPFVFESWSNLQITGNGTPSSPAVFRWNPPTSGNTLVRINSQKGAATNIAAHVNLLKEYEDEYKKYLKIGTASINNVPIYDTLEITKTMFGLGNVANVSDKEMPVSHSQSALFNTYSKIDHQHTLDEFGIVSATSIQAGTVLFSDYRTGVVVDRDDISQNYTPIATQKRAGEMIDIADRSESLSDNVLPSGALRPIRYGTSGNEAIQTTFTGTRLNIPNPVRYFVGKLYTIPPFSVNLNDYGPAVGNTVYFYANIDQTTDTAEYRLSTQEFAENEYMTYIGKFGFRSVNGVAQWVGAIYNRTRLGNFVEMGEHANNPTAHSGGSYSKEAVGLGVVKNQPPSWSLVKPTFGEVFNTWRRFSHGAHSTSSVIHHAGRGTAQPANLAALNGWVYDEQHDRIRMPFNSGSFVGFVSPESYGNYVLDTVLSSDASDDDQIGVLIGFYVDENNVEHTLTVNIANDGRYRNRYNTSEFVNCAIIFNSNQTGEGRAQDNLATSITPTRQAAVNWDVLGDIRLRVERRGDVFVVDLFQFTHYGDLNELVETIRFDISNGTTTNVRYVNGKSQPAMIRTALLPEMVANFRGTSPFGYVSHSQENSTYRNLKRPDEDSRNFYATLPTLLDEVSYFSKKRFIVEKTRLLSMPTPQLPALHTYSGLIQPTWGRYNYEALPWCVSVLNKDVLGVFSLEPQLFDSVDSLMTEIVADVEIDRDAYNPWG